MRKQDIINRLRYAERTGQSFDRKTIEEKLRALRFSQESSQLLNWELFHLKDQFVAIYRGYEEDRNTPPKGYLVIGSCTDQSIHKKDLKAISEFFRRRKSVKFCEEPDRFGVAMGVLGAGGVSISMDGNPFALVVGGFIFGGTLGLFSSALIQAKIDSHYGSQLSDQAMEYFYSPDAENYLSELRS